MVESYPHNNPAPDPNPISGMFVGRQREMADLKAAMEDAISVRGGLVMLAGEPGIGKSRATQEIGAYVELRPEPTGVIPFPTSPPPPYHFPQEGSRRCFPWVWDLAGTGKRLRRRRLFRISSRRITQR